jgi:hypothetical protein
LQGFSFKILFSELELIRPSHSGSTGRVVRYVRPRQVHGGGGCEGFLHQGKTPEKESPEDITKDMSNDPIKVARILCLTKYAPACFPAS